MSTQTTTPQASAEPRTPMKKRDLLIVTLMALGGIAGLTLLLLRFIIEGITVETIAVLSLLFLGGLVGFGYWVVRRYQPNLETALDESHYERFLRLCGLYNSIPVEVRRSADKRSAAEEFEKLRDEIATWMDPRVRQFKRRDAADYVHNLHLLFLQLAPIDYLAISMPTMRSEFRQVVSPSAWQAYESVTGARPKCDGNAAEMERQLRSEAVFLLAETRRQSLLQEHVEGTRQRLIKSALNGWWHNAIPMLALVIVYLTCQVMVQMAAPRAEGKIVPGSTAAAENVKPDPAPAWVRTFAERYLILQPKAPAAKETQDYTNLFQLVLATGLLALAGIAGATGGMLSVIQRVQNASSQVDASTDLRTLSQAETAVFYGPINGMLFAIVLSIIFAGRIFSAPIFPTVDEAVPWYFTLWNAMNLAKWLLWAFIAGFSERLVPNLLSTLSKEAEAQAAKGPGNIATEREKAVQPVGSNGANGSQPAAVAAPARTATPAGPPVLYAHADPVPPDATEITLTGENFHIGTVASVNGEAKPPSSILEVGETSLRLRLEPGDLVQREVIGIRLSNPQPDGGDSEEVSIAVSQAGG